MAKSFNANNSSPDKKAVLESVQYTGPSLTLNSNVNTFSSTSNHQLINNNHDDDDQNKKIQIEESTNLGIASCSVFLNVLCFRLQLKFTASIYHFL